MGFTTNDLIDLGRKRASMGMNPLFDAIKPAAKRSPNPQRHLASNGEIGAGAILSCDPSSQKFGWAILKSAEGGRVTRVDSGVITPSKGKSAGDGYTQIVNKIVDLCELFSIVGIIFEVPSGNVAYQMRGMSAAAYGRAVEIPHAVAVMLGVPWRAIDVATWKGNSTKDYTWGMVKAMTGYMPVSMDESDAIGLGCWWIRQQR
jgi:Holliday junction resolvasome RuvABC endonuclease subunit